jgi:hypothetical protein
MVDKEDEEEADNIFCSVSTCKQTKTTTSKQSGLHTHTGRLYFFPWTLNIGKKSQELEVRSISKFIKMANNDTEDMISPPETISADNHDGKYGCTS